MNPCSHRLREGQEKTAKQCFFRKFVTPQRTVALGKTCTIVEKFFGVKTGLPSATVFVWKQRGSAPNPAAFFKRKQ